MLCYVNSYISKIQVDTLENNLCLAQEQGYFVVPLLKLISPIYVAEHDF